MRVQRGRRREVPETYRRANSRQGRRHGIDRQHSLARALSTQWQRHEHLHGPQSNRQVAGREGPALRRVREGAAELLRGVAVGKKGKAATRRYPAAGSRHRTAVRSHVTLKSTGTLWDELKHRTN